MSFSKMYDYQLRAYFNERISDLNHEYFFIPILIDKDDISLVRWHDLFNGPSFVPIDRDFLNEADAERLIRLLSLAFNVFDILLSTSSFAS
ncbi:hypothetical protein ABH892_004984 [Paenibacillus sp. RC254]|uniref:hypothetical protein n=1 Tax=unclassified Paenibacillus TaxID=185978 RepID=UPI0024B93F77|nr:MULTISPECIES: hypothetical protein [unclassified Paenibacillus]